ncbi:MAG TPA: hypothetical protein VK660_02345 [Xanthomonadaceae bacterium]|nr:hypothetical protein [Xanthomonadaceae bacterium]
MNPAEETNLRAEVVVLRELVKCLISLLPNDKATTAALEATAKHTADLAPQHTHDRVALQRAITLIGPLTIKRQGGLLSFDDDLDDEDR